MVSITPRVLVGAEREPVRPADPRRGAALDGLGDVAGVASAVARRARSASCGEASAIPVIAGVVPAVEDGDVLGHRDPRARPRRGLEVDVRRRRGRRRAARRGRRVKSARAARPAAARGAGRRRDAVDGRARRAARTRPRLVAECSQPCGPAKSTSLRAASAGVSRSRASSSSSSQPASLIGASSRSRWFIAAPLQAADPERAAAGEPARRAPHALDRLLLGLLAVLDDVAGWKRIPCGDLAPDRRAPQQELEVHREVLELLALRVAHDRQRLGVGLDREPLLVPADRLRLLGQRGAQPRERARLAPAAPRAARGTGRSPSHLPVSFGHRTLRLFRHHAVAVSAYTVGDKNHIVRIMTTILDRGDAVVLRCDSCRRLWPVERRRLASAGWREDPPDRHTCPGCADVPAPAGQDAAGES